MRFLLILIWGIFIHTNSWASPATNVQVDYNPDTQILHIEADHPTDRMDRYYVRLVTIIANNQKESQNFTFPRQYSPSKFIGNIPYAANPGDHLDIQIFSSEGGLAIASLDVPNPSQEKGINNEQETLSIRKRP